MRRPISTFVLAGLSAAAALSSLLLTLQFLGVIDWGDDDLDFWGGKWAGVLLFGAASIIALLVTYGWLTLKPWAFTITMLAALLGLAVPISSLMAGTETWSTALLPILVNGTIIVMLFSRNVRAATQPTDNRATTRESSSLTNRSSDRAGLILGPDDI